MAEGREDEECSLGPDHQRGTARVRKKRRRGCVQLAGLVAGARLVLCKDREMSYRNWMGRDIKSNPGYLNLGACQ